LLTEYLEKQKNHTIFLWEGKELEPSNVKSIPTATPRVFKLPQTLFVLLDSIRPGNGKQLVKLFHETVATTDVEMIFFMLIRQIRLLLALSSVVPVQMGIQKNNLIPDQVRDDKENQIDELKRLAPWQKTKLQQQARHFSQEQLKNLYHHLFLLEVGQKTGSFPNSILTNIDFLLLEI
ncbi:MAG TPA: hypothetical protein VLF20_04400, partial [Patescibacteria group bacterium]|nr:hypothetical protein [Patescibacteria group bacterium]